MAAEAIGGITIPVPRPQAPVASAKAAEPAPCVDRPGIAADGVAASAKADAPDGVAAVNVENVDLSEAQVVAANEVAPAAKQAPELFGHKPGYTLSLFLKVPLWQDDGKKITNEQWAKMPESQREEILALYPNDQARDAIKSILTNVPVGVAAKRLAEDAGKGLRAIEKFNEKYEKNHPQAPVK